MKKQVIVIHGGEMHASYAAYLASLKAQHFPFEWLAGKSDSWKSALPKALGKDFEVLAPKMPNQLNAKYEEWRIWFGKMIPHFEKSVVLVGHSLGGIFLAKYLAENKFPKEIKGLFLVAAPFDNKRMGEKLHTFVLPKNLGRLKRLGDKLCIYQSEDDTIVPPANARGYAKTLPEARIYLFNDRGHFLDDKFPEIIKDIKAAYRV